MNFHLLIHKLKQLPLNTIEVTDAVTDREMELEDGKKERINEEGGEKRGVLVH